MTTKKALLTADDLLNLGDDGRFYELLDGELVEMTPPGGEHGRITLKVGSPLFDFVSRNGLGVVLGGDTGIILRRNPDRVRAPDVCFIANDRIPPQGVPEGYLEIVPDLIVEIVSPNDRAGAILEKVAEWLLAGARLVWVMYPRTRSVMAYQSLDAIRVYSGDDVITGAPVLPDFRIKVSDLFS